MADDRSAINMLYRKNASALRAGDIGTLAALYTEDAIQLPPDGRALEGWEAIRSSLRAELEDATVDPELEVLETQVAGRWAFARGRYRMAVRRASEGTPTLAEGNWLDILERQSDGSWRIARATWTTIPPPGSRSVEP
jgi:uncharacterized protein (TIGR02246 family)